MWTVYDPKLPLKKLLLPSYRANKQTKKSTITKLLAVSKQWNIDILCTGTQNSNTSSVSPEMLHWSACSQLWRKLARQIAFIIIESKAIIRKNARGARARANLCNNFGETEEVHNFWDALKSGSIIQHKTWKMRLACLRLKEGPCRVATTPEISFRVNGTVYDPK